MIPTINVELDDPYFIPRQLAWQFGCTVTLIQPGIIQKIGGKVRQTELTTMRLVKKHAPSVRIPSIHGWAFRYKLGKPYSGEVFLGYVPGQTLKSAWADLDDERKSVVCQEIWDIVAILRTIPRPDDLQPGFYRTVDGSPSRDALLGTCNDLPPCDLDDEMLRNRIYDQFVAMNGLSYKDVDDLPESLPRSTVSVFAHGDIGPRNIIVDEDGHVKALLDWESSGWFPDWWEYAQMKKWCHPLECEWQDWMERTRPVQWDISAIQKARRVLF